MELQMPGDDRWRLISRLSHLSGFPIHLFQDGQIVFPLDIHSESDIFLCDPGLLPWLADFDRLIVMEPDFHGIFYGKIMADRHFCVVGPVKWETVFEDTIHQYLRRHHAANGIRPGIPNGSAAKVNDVLHLMAGLLNVEISSSLPKVMEQQDDFLKHQAEENTEMDTAIDFETGQILNEDAEEGIHHVPYELESRSLKALEDGDEKEYFRLFSEIQGYSGGKFAKNEIKYLEYSAVSMVTLQTRAAIRGGVPQNEAYALSDILLNRASYGKNGQDYIQILQDGLTQFFRLVKKYQDTSHHSYHIRKCKAYIRTNLNQPLSPEIIAGELHLNKNYLMTLFSTYEGEPLMQYVQRKRILAASDLLKYSDKDIMQIAAYYQFQTQSHFGAAFKKYLGMSPAAYRKKYKPVG